MATLLDTFQRKKKNKCVNEKHFMSSTPAPEVRCVLPIKKNKKKRVVFSLNETWFMESRCRPQFHGHFGLTVEKTKHLPSLSPPNDI